MGGITEQVFGKIYQLLRLAASSGLCRLSAKGAGHSSLGQRPMEKPVNNTSGLKARSRIFPRTSGWRGTSALDGSADGNLGRWPRLE
jgi:hypothetical protein